MAEAIPTLARGGAPERSRARRIKNLAGQTFGRWHVDGIAPGTSRKVHWLCTCECGARGVVAGHHLRAGATRSCGCLSREVHSRRAAQDDQSPLPDELWAPVHDGAAYQVSSLGRFRGFAGLIMPGRLDRNGYPRVSYRNDEGVQRTEFVHLLVIRAFVGPAPEGKECDHKDRDRANPRLDNLRYVTHQENIDNSSKSVGEAHGMAKLTEREVREILAIPPCPRWGRRGKGHHPNSVISIAERYGIDDVTVLEIRRGEAWRHVFDEMVAAHPHLAVLALKRRTRARRRSRRA